MYFTQAMLYKIVELAWSAYHRIGSLETSIVGIIDIDLTAIVIPLKTTIDELQAKMGVCKHK